MKTPAEVLWVVGPTVAAALMLSAPSAAAGEVADMATEAETLLQANEPATAFDAMEAAIDAFWREAPLIIEDARFDSEGDEATFAPSGEVGVYLRPLGYGFTTDGANNRIALDADIEIRTPGGLILAKSDEFGRLEWAGPGKNRNFAGRISIAMPDLKAGGYELLVTLTDRATQKSASVILPFAVTDE